MSDESKDGKGKGNGSQADRARSEREGLLTDLASRVLRVGAEAVSVGAEKLREKGESAASLTARGKDEVMTILANEIRSYIEKLKVGEEVRSFLDDYSLEIQASVRLKALTDEEKTEPAEPVSMEVALQPKTAEAPPEPEVVEPEVVPEQEPPQLPRPEPTKPAAAKQPATKKKRTSRKKRSTRKSAPRKTTPKEG